MLSISDSVRVKSSAKYRANSTASATVSSLSLLKSPLIGSGRSVVVSVVVVEVVSVVVVVVSVVDVIVSVVVMDNSD